MLQVLHELSDFVIFLLYTHVTYKVENLVCATPPTLLGGFCSYPHTDQHGMKMTVKIGFCDVASFTSVLRLCHEGASLSYRHISSYYWHAL